MATPASTAASRALARGKSFLGYRETPARSNRTRFGKQYGWDGVAWCVIFVWCILQDTGTSGGVIKTASTGAMERWAKTVGRTVTTPRAGDLIILRNSKGATIHTEFVYSYSGGRLLGLGGNTSGGSGSVADGGTVAINDRTSLWKRGRIKFVRPFYGVTTDDVKTVQKAAGLKVDGILGAATVAGVKRLQTAAGLAADGFPGPTTMSALALGTGGGGASASKPAAKPVTSTKAPAFPLPRRAGAMYFYGPASGGKTSVSGTGLNTAVPADVVKVGGRWRSNGLAKFQAQLIARGWSELEKDGADGRYGDTMAKVVRQFQKVIGQPQDGKIGPDTWRAAWETAVK